MLVDNLVSTGLSRGLEWRELIVGDDGRDETGIPATDRKLSRSKSGPVGPERSLVLDV